MSRILNIVLVAIIMTIGLSVDAHSQTCNSGRINGIYHTSCFPWTSTDGTISVPTTKAGGTNVVKLNDTRRLQDALNASLGRIVFDEADYFINDELIVYSYRTIVGTGRSSYLGTIVVTPTPSPTPAPANSNLPYSNHLSSKIVQTANNKAVFKIGEGVQDVAIRDLALVAGYGTSGTMGILAQGGNGSNQSSVGFQFSNLKFTDFAKGIYVNAQNNEWQFDNIRLDHSAFENCTEGVRIKSHNSGWHVTSVSFLVPVDGYGIYLEKSTYTTLDLLIGNGTIDGDDKSEALVYVKDHANLSIRNTVAENFRYDVHIDGDSVYGTGRTYPIYLMNNHFMSGVTLKDSTVVSMGNQFGFSSIDTSAIAKGTTQLYSIGDKFCFEGAACESNKGYTLQDDAVLFFGSNKYKTEVDTLKLGSRTYANLGSPGNGTTYYCSDCQQTSTCSGSGSGAFAKRINGGWVCN